MSDTETSRGGLVDEMIERLLIRREGAARVCDMSLRTWDRAVAAGKTPAPVRVGGSGTPRWRVDELRAWITAGCPDRRRWEAIRGGQGR